MSFYSDARFIKKQIGSMLLQADVNVSLCLGMAVPQARGKLATEPRSRFLKLCGLTESSLRLADCEDGYTGRERLVIQMAECTFA